MVVLGVRALEGGRGELRGRHRELGRVGPDTLEHPSEVLLHVDAVVFRGRYDAEQDRGTVRALGTPSEKPRQPCLATVWNSRSEPLLSGGRSGWSSQRVSALQWFR